MILDKTLNTLKTYCENLSANENAMFTEHELADGILIILDKAIDNKQKVNEISKYLYDFIDEQETGELIESEKEEVKQIIINGIIEELDRVNDLLNNSIGYIVELKDHESVEEVAEFFENVIGLNEEEFAEYDIEVA